MAVLAVGTVGKVLLTVKEVYVPAFSLCMKLGTPVPLSCLQFSNQQSGPPSEAKAFQFVLNPEAPGVFTEERGRIFGLLVYRENDQRAGKSSRCRHLQPCSRRSSPSGSVL